MFENNYIWNRICKKKIFVKVISQLISISVFSLDVNPGFRFLCESGKVPEKNFSQREMNFKRKL